MEALQGIKKSIYFISFPLSFIGFIMPLYAAELGAGVFEVALLYSIFSLCSIVIRPLVGKWIDQKGRKSGVLFGLVCYTLVLLIFLLGNNYTALVIARSLQSIAGAFLWISVNAMVSDVSTAKDRSKNFGDMAQVSNKGAMTGSFIGFSLIYNLPVSNGFRFIFLAYMIISLIGVYSGFKYGRETLQPENETVRSEKPVDARFKCFLAVMMVLSLVGTMIAPIYLVYMREHITRNISLISSLYIPAAILSLFLPKHFGRLSDSIGRKKLLTLGMFIQAIVLFFIPTARSYYSFMLAYTLLSIGSMLVEPARMSLVTELTEGRNRGSSYGYYSTAIALGGVIGPMLGSFIYKLVGYAALFHIQALTVIGALIVTSLILNQSQKYGEVHGVSINEH